MLHPDYIGRQDQICGFEGQLLNILSGLGPVQRCCRHRNVLITLFVQLNVSLQTRRIIREQQKQNEHQPLIRKSFDFHGATRPTMSEGTTAATSVSTTWRTPSGCSTHAAAMPSSPVPAPSSNTRSNLLPSPSRRLDRIEKSVWERRRHRQRDRDKDREKGKSEP